MSPPSRSSGYEPCRPPPETTETCAIRRVGERSQDPRSACADPLSSTAEQLATCISIHRDRGNARICRRPDGSRRTPKAGYRLCSRPRAIPSVAHRSLGRAPHNPILPTSTDGSSSVSMAKPRSSFSFALHFAMRSFAAASDGGATSSAAWPCARDPSPTSRGWAGRRHARRTSGDGRSCSTRSHLQIFNSWCPCGLRLVPG
jgi:hypothetical protein